MTMSERQDIFEVPGAGWIFRHPRRAAQMMQTLVSALEEAQASVGAADAGRLELEERLRGLKGERSALQASNTELSLKLRKLTEDHESLQREIDEVQAMFGKVQSMKERYENRIARYKAETQELRRELKRQEEAALAEITPLNTEPVNRRGKNRRMDPEKTHPAPPGRTDGSEGDWYLPLEL